MNNGSNEPEVSTVRYGGGGATTVSAGVFPPQHWASKNGLIQLRPNGAAVTSSNVLDRMLIQETFYRWGIAWDEALLDVIRSLFTQDGELVITLGSVKPISRHTGPDAIAKYVEATSKVQADQRRHAMTNVVIDRLGATEATTIAYGIVTIAENGLCLGATVIYSAELRKETDGVWRFLKFVIGMDEYVGRRASTKAAFDQPSTK
jgi:SnoaL-like domain